MFDIVFVGKNIENFEVLKERYPVAKKANSLQDAQKISLTKFVWIVWDDVQVAEDFFFDYVPDEWSQDVIHLFLNGEHYDGICLVPKFTHISDKEIDHRFFVHNKKVDIVASTPHKFEVFYTNKYEDYLHALEVSKYDMFWIVPNYVNPSKRFKFDSYFGHLGRNTNYAYLNGKYHDGIVLCSKKAKFSRREFDYKFIANKKEIDVVISTPNPYDIVFISYQEPNADENYERILKRFPNCKRVHGVKGIHQAHIEAAKLCDTDMFWIIDGDAIIVDDFKFDYQVARWDKECVHVWRSQNPINDMVYGYGGVKLFPTELTVNMDTSKPDMTTSISSKFKAVHDISNITAFNTDEFNSFKSGFRECCKLSSKVIDRQKDDETNERLRKWCTIGIDRPFGKYAIAGAKAGAAYGARHQGDLQALKMINDFDWLKEQFDNANI